MVAPAHQQHASDFVTVLADPTGPAEEAVVSGVTLRLIREPVDYGAYKSMEVVRVERQNIYLLRADLGFIPIPMAELVIDGHRWVVESVPWKGEVLQIEIVRYLA